MDPFMCYIASWLYSSNCSFVFSLPPHLTHTQTMFLHQKGDASRHSLVDEAPGCTPVVQQHEQRPVEAALGGPEPAVHHL